MASLNLFDTFNKLIPILVEAQPKNILVLYNGEEEFFKLCQTALQNNHLSPTWNSINFTSNTSSLFNKTFKPSIKNDLNKLGQYDFVIMASIIEILTPTQYLEWCTTLLSFASNGIIMLEVVGSGTTYKEYVIPLLFHKLNYIFTVPSLTTQTTRIHFIQPPQKYPSMKQDSITLKKIPYKRLNIAFIFSHDQLTGTAKNAVQLIKQLLKRGHNITIYRKGKVGEEVLPNWCNLDYSLPNLKLSLITKKASLETCIDPKTDIIVICTIILLPSIRNFNKPVILWEKGFRQLFGEFPTLERGKSKSALYANLYRLPTYILSVSPIIKDLLKERYNRDSFILPNGVDTTAYFPLDDKTAPNDFLTILLVGNPSTRYKRLDRAIEALDRLATTTVKFKVNWICQDASHGVTRSYLHYIVAPTQTDLQTYYRQSDILISASDFESFSTPPLEALASGVSVLAVNNGGIELYGKDNINMLLCKQNDPDALYNSLYKLATTPQLRKQLTLEGRKTALEFDYFRIALLAEQYFLCIYDYHTKREE